MGYPRLLEEAVRAARSSLGRNGKAFTLAAVGERSDGATVTSINGWITQVEPKHHAERRAARKLDVGSTLYVARVRKDGAVAMSKPCQACEAVLRSRGVVRVHFTVRDGAWGTLDFEANVERVRT